MAKNTLKSFRTIAIIAHVDHGKTTLLDHMLRQSGTLNKRGAVVDRVMDSNPQERERGITILAKCTAVEWQGHRVQIVDTPGHQDFGGEVERVLRMVDAVLLLVDAVEGPMPQTRYVLRKAMENGLRPIVVINKMDRPEARPAHVLDAVFDLCAALGATDEQLDFPVVYAAGREGWASADEDTRGGDLTPLFDTILKHVPLPQDTSAAPLQMQVATLDYSSYLGRIAIGRVHAGTIRRGEKAVCCRRDGRQDTFRVTKLMSFRGLDRIDCEQAKAGEIIALAGVEGVTVGETICDVDQPLPLPLIPIDEPTITMTFSANTSPRAGEDGQFVTSRQVRERLLRELEHNVGLRMEMTDQKEVWRLLGRGTLHLSVLIETMRREGYELSIGQPQVVEKDGKEPYEQVVITIPNAFAGVIIERLSKRGGSFLRHEVDEEGEATLELEIPSRGLIGYRSEFLTSSHGEGLLYATFARFGPRNTARLRRDSGAMIAKEAGTATTYALHQLQERGKMLVGPQERVYGGMVVGLHSRRNDIVVNPCKKKQLNNFRNTGHEEALHLTPKFTFSLEEALELIGEDELVEVTPRAIRIRKRLLNHDARKRSEKSA